MNDFISTLADFYASFVKFLTWFVLAVAVLGIITAVSEGAPFWVVLAIIGSGVFGIVACGASAVVIDIMENIRRMSRDSDQQKFERIKARREKNAQESGRVPVSAYQAEKSRRRDQLGGEENAKRDTPTAPSTFIDD